MRLRIHVSNAANDVVIFAIQGESQLVPETIGPVPLAGVLSAESVYLDNEQAAKRLNLPPVHFHSWLSLIADAAFRDQVAHILPL